MRALRFWLARKLMPRDFDELERLCYLRSEMACLYRWTGEFPDLEAGIEWLYESYRRRYGIGGDTSRPMKWPPDIADFREQLRRRRNAA